MDIEFWLKNELEIWQIEKLKNRLKKKKKIKKKVFFCLYS